jgi:hypothetical protein
LGQKRNVTDRPLSEVRLNWVALPEMEVICARPNHAWLLNTAPVRRWQARQWQVEIRTGSPSQVS